MVLTQKESEMKQADFAPSLSAEEVREMVGLGSDPKLRSAAALLADAPDEWDRAMADPHAWLRAKGIRVPECVRFEFVREQSASMPLPPGPIPDPEWVPFMIRQFNCRTYWVPKKDDQGRVTGYEEVSICFGFRIVPAHIPGGPRG
jgi:hypothetical protein